MSKIAPLPTDEQRDIFEFVASGENTLLEHLQEARHMLASSQANASKKIAWIDEYLAVLIGHYAGCVTVAEYR
jgi:hypothetical protein